MPKSIKSSQPLRENLSTNLSPRDKADSEAVPHLLARLPIRKMLRRKNLKRKPRNNSPRRRRKLPLLPKKKMQILEISSDDTHPHIYSKSNITSPRE